MNTIKSLAVAGLLATASFTTAQATMITGGFTGNWFNAETSGQGFQLQVLPDGRAIAFWFTYDANGNQVWLIGDDDIQGNRLEMEMLRPVGARFGSNFDPNDVDLQPFGEVTLTFDDCNQGTVNWQSNDAQFGSGSMPLERLTSSAGVSCSGSLSDNLSGADPVLDFSIPLTNESGISEASADADYESRPGRVEFDVEVEDMPTGDYTLWVDSVDRGIIQVQADDDGSEGEIEFSSPQDDSDLLLDFDPLGALIEISDDSGIVFSGILDPALGPPDDDDDDDDNGESGSVSSEIEVDFVNTGQDSDASGDAEFEQHANRTEFEVEIEDLDVGTYELWVGNELRAEIEVIQFGDDTEGEVEFSDPAEAGKLPLDFDPRGQLITIEQSGTVYLSVEFPSESGNGDDGSNDDEDDEDEDEDDDDEDEDEDDEDDDEDDDDDDDDGDD